MSTNASTPDDMPGRQSPSEDTVVPESSAAEGTGKSADSEPDTKVVSNSPDQVANTVAEDATLPPRASDADSVPDDATLPPRPPAAATATELTAPAARVKYFGEYELLQEIARGGMGVVYKARQTKLNRIVALKMILSGQLASKEDVDRFYIEAEAAAKLEHPGIVPIFEIGEHDNQHFFSMGFIDGESLADRVKEGPLPPREAAAITKQVVEAIAFAHQNNVIHRDLKPANVLIDGNGQAKVTDFGLAKQTDRNAELTGTGQIMGTPGYMPPEQASGDTTRIGPASDIYSLGAVLYCLLTGRPPFQAATAMDTLLQVLEASPVPPRMLNGAVATDLESICLKCLEKNPQERYPTAQALIDDLDRYTNGEAVSADRSSTNRLARAVVRETRHTEIMAIHSRAWLWQAPVVFVLCLATNVLIWQGYRTASPYLVIWIPGVLGLLVPGWYQISRGNRLWSATERQMGQLWWMFLAACLLIVFLNLLTGDNILEVLPHVIVILALTLGCMAAILRGSFYLLAALCAISSVVVAVFPSFGVAFFGAAFAIGLFWPAWKHSRIPLDRS